MQWYFSKTTKGFYNNVMNKSIPSDAVAITNEVYNTMQTAPTLGKSLDGDENGNPIMIAPVAASGNDLINSQIQALEATQTKRRMREALAGTDGGWLANLETQISALRAQLT